MNQHDVSTSVESAVPLESKLDARLLVALRPVEPTLERKSRMLQHILARVREAAPKQFVTVRKTDGSWSEICPGVFQKPLVENEKLRAHFYRMAPGSIFPAHDHPSDEECVCLEGEINLGGIIIHAGDFHLAPQGMPHGEITTKTGCLIYIRLAATLLPG